MKISILGLFVCLAILFSCSDENSIMLDVDEGNIPPMPDKLKGPYTIEGSNLLENDLPVHFKGANCLQTFGLNNADLMNEWNIEITREFIGNLREQPIDGGAIKASDGFWYHPLQKIVDRNRANNRITILCPFGWVNGNGQQTLFTGLNPSSQLFYDEYKNKMKLIANHFKEQPDVWIEVWNEPYDWNNENGYHHDLWLKDMKDMVDNLRWVDGFQNIILVPGNEQGQSEDALITYGKSLMAGRYNLLFDLHAYEKWLINTTEDGLVFRIQNIKNKKIAFIIGEVGIQNLGNIMPAQHFLDAAESTDITTLAWVWNQNSQDNNALLMDNGQPHSTNTNNLWGTIFRDFLGI